MPFIHPLPVFEADADPKNRDAMTDAEIYASLETPKSLVVKFGMMKLVAEYPYDGDVKPGCGSKLVARTHRGTELVEMLTTTCENAGCGKSITRQEMLDYIENSGGKDYPFYTDGKVLRVATIEDLNHMSAMNSARSKAIKAVREHVERLRLDMKIVEVEPILGDELLTVYFMAEERVDFRELVRELASHFSTRIEMRQVGARDEARLVADYERCGQHCCCKNFLKVLKPVSMRAAKVQKATLDPLKISGRCGRLMCCLRYEDQTYRQLKKNLPHRKTRVGTPYGPGIVLDTRILAQLVLVGLDHNREQVAVPVEDLLDPDNCPAPGEYEKQQRKEREAEAAAQASANDPLRGMTEEEVRDRTDDRKRSRRKRGSKNKQQDNYRKESKSRERSGDKNDEQSTDGSQSVSSPGRKKRRKRRGGKKRSGPANAQGNSPQSDNNTAGGSGSGDKKKKKRRRNRRRRGGGERSSGGGQGGS